MKTHLSPLASITLLFSISLWVYGSCTYPTLVSPLLMIANQADDLEVERVSVSPSVAHVNRKTTITVTAQLKRLKGLLPGGVTLLQYNNTGQVIKSLGQLYDDGSHGDDKAGDGVFTAQLVIKESQPMMIYLRASIALRGKLRRVISEQMIVSVEY
jgi:hypothetical protein